MATNEYGLDVRYFREKLNSMIRDLDRYTPDEVFNELSRLMMTAANQAQLDVRLTVKDGK